MEQQVPDRRSLVESMLLSLIRNSKPSSFRVASALDSKTKTQTTLAIIDIRKDVRVSETDVWRLPRRRYETRQHLHIVYQSPSVGRRVRKGARDGFGDR